MFALGTLIDTAAIFFAGFCGNCFGHKLTVRHQESLTIGKSTKN